MFKSLVDGLGVWPAQLLIGGLFVLTHLDNPGMTGATRLWAGVNIFLASILFGLAYVRTRSLALPIGIHFGAAIGREDLLLRLAGQLERSAPWSHRRPPG